MPEIGKKAPAFKGLDQDGNLLQLSDFKGKKLILYFYPKDMTATCTVEACNLRDNYKILQKKGYAIVGVSADDSASHQRFIAKNKLPFPLIADTEKEIIKKYEVWGEKMLYGKKYMGILRKTFVIDEKGKITNVIDKVKSKEHSAQLLEKEK